MIEDGTSKSSGYVEIPIHVLYKTEYIDSAVQRRKANSKMVGSIFKKCGTTISNAISRLKDHIANVLRGYYQEIILNNVDCKTKQNMVGYIRSLNLCANEFVDPDGTRVIVVDIAPIKNKPEMDDLLVYLGNEKLKIARREEIKNKQFKKNTRDNTCKPCTKNWNVVEETRSPLNDKMLKLEDEKALSKQAKKEMNKSKKNNAPKKESFLNAKKRLSPIPTKDVLDEPQKSETKKPKNKAAELFTPTKTETQVKVRMQSKKSIANNVSLFKKCDVPIAKKSLNSSTSDPTEHRPLSSSGRSCEKTRESLRDEYSNSFSKDQSSNGIGIFWNTESVMCNDRKMTLIERAEAVKEMSVNVLAKYYGNNAAGSKRRVRNNVRNDMRTVLTDAVRMADRSTIEESHRTRANHSSSARLNFLDRSLTQPRTYKKNLKRIILATGNFTDEGNPSSDTTARNDNGSISRTLGNGYESFDTESKDRDHSEVSAIDGPVQKRSEAIEPAGLPIPTATDNNDGEKTPFSEKKSDGDKHKRRRSFKKQPDICSKELPTDLKNSERPPFRMAPNCGTDGLVDVEKSGREHAIYKKKPKKLKFYKFCKKIFLHRNAMKNRDPTSDYRVKFPCDTMESDCPADGSSSDYKRLSYSASDRDYKTLTTSSIFGTERESNQRINNYLDREVNYDHGDTAESTCNRLRHRPAGVRSLVRKVYTRDLSKREKEKKHGAASDLFEKLVSFKSHRQIATESEVESCCSCGDSEIKTVRENSSYDRISDATLTSDWQSVDTVPTVSYKLIKKIAKLHSKEKRK